MLYSAFGRGLLLAAIIGIPAIALAETAAPPSAVVYLINLKDGDTVANPFKVQFGLSGMGVALAGVEKANTGHPSSVDRRHALGVAGHNRHGEMTAAANTEPGNGRRRTTVVIALS